eukprot:gene35720-44052_t
MSGNVAVRIIPLDESLIADSSHLLVSKGGKVVTLKTLFKVQDSKEQSAVFPLANMKDEEDTQIDSKVTSLTVKSRPTMQLFVPRNVNKWTKKEDTKPQATSPVPSVTSCANSERSDSVSGAVSSPRPLSRVNVASNRLISTLMRGSRLKVPFTTASVSSVSSVRSTSAADEPVVVKEVVQAVSIPDALIASDMIVDAPIVATTAVAAVAVESLPPPLNKDKDSPTTPVKFTMTLPSKSVSLKSLVRRNLQENDRVAKVVSPEQNQKNDVQNTSSREETAPVHLFGKEHITTARDDDTVTSFELALSDSVTRGSPPKILPASSSSLFSTAMSESTTPVPLRPMEPLSSDPVSTFGLRETFKAAHWRLTVSVIPQ